MKLIEALNVLRGAPKDAEPFRAHLATGFTPLHLSTFFAAHLQSWLPTHRVQVEAGLFGDLPGNVERLARARVEAAAVVVEWADLDPRLGLRRLGGWRPADLGNVRAEAQAALDRIREGLVGAAARFPVALALPTLPLPPAASAPGWQADAFELDLRDAVGRFAASLGTEPRVRVASGSRLDRLSPPADRHDVKADLHSGFPYRIPHADVVGQLLARLVAGAPPKKGLITDLDDTLWSGILGEVGVDGVAWDLEHGGQIHGLYQQLLRALADIGVLVGASSKNDPKVVAEALKRTDLVLPGNVLFPVEASWGRKSEAVGRILKAWNVGADAVVFVDDSPMELAEVAAAHPGLECLAFPSRDEAAALALLEGLRDRFGKTTVLEEDRMRAESLRRAGALHEAREAAGSPDRFLEQAQSEVTLSWASDADDPRALELINKTNQFNLNGRRVAEGAWRERLADPSTVLLRVSYQDKYGPLGKIAVLLGRREGTAVTVDSWVMSCRAFSRRIEHRCLEQLFTRLAAAEIRFDYEATPRNGPLTEFFTALLGEDPGPGLRLPRAAFLERCPPLFQQVKESDHA